MLICVTYLLVFFLVRKILRAPSPADAVGYLLISGFIPLPVLILGNSVDAGVFPIDVCITVYVLRHGRRCLSQLDHSSVLSGGVPALLGLGLLSTASALFNFFLVDPVPWTFYSFTVLKFWEYTVLALTVLGCRPNRQQLRAICFVLLAGIAIYECLHIVHLSGLLEMSGRRYFGPRAADFGTDIDDDQMGSGAAAFSDRTAWFLTSYRIVIGGTASIGALVSLFIFESEARAKKRLAGAAAILCVLSVLATSSRSDIAGLFVAVVIFVLCSDPRRWPVYVGVGLTAAGLYTVLLNVAFPGEQRTLAVERLSEFWDSSLRSEGDYASRAYDRAAMSKYLPEHPRELLIGVGPGNYHWYASQRITMNSFGHNSYLHWTGELGIGGFVLVVGWCLLASLYAMRRVRRRGRISALAARTALALIISRMIAGWGAESLFGTQGMGYYSLLFVGTLYLLFSVASMSESNDGIRTSLRFLEAQPPTLLAQRSTA